MVHLAAGVVLAAFVGALYYPLLFTNRVLATGDILLYFYPYREAVASALRQGHIPFWNPYLFGGAPLLANPQAAVLYPLHWPLIWLSPTKQVYWSAALHTWLLGAGGYWLLRRWGGGAWAGLAAGVALSGAGLVGGLMGHLNQLNVAAWAPWAVICVEGARFGVGARADGRGAGSDNPGLVEHPAAGWPGVLARGLTFAIVVTLMLLAGHTQTVYIVLFGLGAWCLWPLVERQWSEVAARLAVYTGGVLLGVLLSAPQLLPTLELSGLGLRTGGLSFQEATSFSLKPLQLAWTLLPTYGLASLGAIFDTPAYTEFVAYVGLIGLALAVAGAWQGRGRGRAFGIFFVLLGLALGAGRWNPAYFVLHGAVPGFDLFRVPARWMLLYTIGAAVLIGLGVQWVTIWLAGRGGKQARWTWLVPILLVLLLAGDLLLAAQALPHTHPTAPEAVDGVRSAPAHLLTDPERTGVDPAATGRFLGLSTITYDPGDMADYRRIMLESEPPQLDKAAFDDLVIAQKVQELLVPNLALLWRIPSIDGFDGGVLPLQRYNAFAQVLIPPDQFVPDGRLREQLREVPSSRLLNLINVQYLITDKVRDLWFDDVYYDRQIGATLDTARPETTIVVDEAAAGFEATHVDLIAAATAAPEVWAALAGSAVPIAEVEVSEAYGVTATFPLTAGGAAGALLADSGLDSTLAQSSEATVAFRDVDAGKQEYRVRLPLAEPAAPESVQVRLLDDRFAVQVQAATLYDERTGMFAALLPSDRGHFSRVHSGDVKIYANLDLAPRAYVVTQTVAAGDTAQAIELLQAQLAAGPGAAPAVVVECMPAVTQTVPVGAAVPTALIERYTAEEVVVRTQGDQGGVLVLSDAFYPGWQAEVDGQPAPICPANVLFRGVPLPAGEHQVVFRYQPSGWRSGWMAAAAGWLAILILGAVAGRGFRRQSGDAV